MTVKTRYTVAQASIAANTQGQPVAVPTIDSDVKRILTGVFLSISTPGVQLQVLRNGQIISAWDASQFAAAGGYIRLDEDYKVGWEFTFALNNTTNGAANNVNIGFQYQPQV